MMDRFASLSVPVKAGIKHPSGDMLGNSMSDFVTTLLTSNDVKELVVDLFQLAQLPPPSARTTASDLTIFT